MGKGKAVFIDGASLSGMRYPLGTRSYDYKKLFDILEAIGTSPMIGKPLYVVPKSSDGAWTKSLRTIGYDVVVCDTKNGADDRLIIQRISALNPAHVDEIVIVSTDQDYAPALKQKKAEGMRVHWVATRNKDRDGTSPLGQALVSLFDAGTFAYFELGDVRDGITREPMPAETPDDPRKQVSVTMRIPLRHSEVRRFMSSLASLLRRFPGASFTLESK